VPARLLLGAVALLLLIGGATWFALQLNDGEEPGDTGGQQASSSSSSPKEEDEPSESAPSESTPSSEATPTSAAAEKEEFVRSYFEKAPGGTDEAWAMLGPSLKEQGRASYNGFWRGIESVEVQSAKASKNGNTVDVTLVYRSTNGQVSTERKREGLVPDGNGGYLLDTDVHAP
jgi:cytoskeletal protein RodZ